MASAGTDRESISGRRYELDWLRVITTLVVFAYHSAKPFDLLGWHIKNDQLSSVLNALVYFADVWQMPLFFLLAGAAMWFSLEKRSAAQSLAERVRRLVVPFVFGFLVLVPPQVYLELLHYGGQAQPYWQFYPQFFAQIPFEFSIRWFRFGHHLWFLGYLFTFTLVALPLFLLLKREAGRRLMARLSKFFSAPGAIFLLALPFGFSEALLQEIDPTPRGWSHFFFYLPFLLYGFFIMSDERVQKAIRRQAGVALGVGLLTMAAVLVAQLSLAVEARRALWAANPALNVAWRFLKGLNSWLWVLGALGLGMRYLRRDNRFLNYAGPLVLPFFVLHQTVIIAVGFFVVQWAAGVAGKFLVINLASLVVIVALYELVIRRNDVTRFLFGMRPIQPPPTHPAPVGGPALAGE